MNFTLAQLRQYAAAAHFDKVYIFNEQEEK